MSIFGSKGFWDIPCDSHIDGDDDDAATTNDVDIGDDDDDEYHGVVKFSNGLEITESELFIYYLWLLFFSRKW